MRRANFWGTYSGSFLVYGGQLRGDLLAPTGQLLYFVFLLVELLLPGTQLLKEGAAVFFCPGQLSFDVFFLFQEILQEKKEVQM